MHTAQIANDELQFAQIGDAYLHCRNKMNMLEMEVERLQQRSQTTGLAYARQDLDLIIVNEARRLSGQDNRLEAEISTQRACIETKKGELETQGTKLSTITAAAQNDEAKISRFERRVADLETALELGRQNVQSTKDTVARLDRELATSNNSCTTLQAQVLKLETELTERESAARRRL
ncbi:hypothetical protein MMC34_001604 [Xylographa carneopallida]|nr:hypothetical protein [Xylographa carneopallida]